MDRPWSARCQIAFLLIGLSLASGCATLPDDAFRLSPTSLEQRQIQSRKYATLDYKSLIVAGAGVLQDMGYTIDDSDTALGVLTASKQADATDAGQIAGAIALALLTGQSMPIDDEQKIRICLVIQDSLDDPKSSVARITIQREILDTTGRVTRVESIKSAPVYQEFFEKLSKSTFLEANQI